MAINLKFRQLQNGVFGFTHYNGGARDYAEFRPVSPVAAAHASKSAPLDEVDVRRRFSLYPGLAGVEDLDDDMLAECASLVTNSHMKAWQVVWADGSSAMLLVAADYGVIPARLWQLAYTAARRVLDLHMPAVNR